MSKAAPAPASTPVQPVIVGGDIGAYSLARAFHEAYGVRSIVISRLRGWHVDRSAIIENVTCADPFDAAQLAPVIEEIARGRTTAPVILLGSADATVKAIIALRDQLGRLPEGWRAPYVGMDAFRAGTEKQNFTALCEKVGVDHPATRVVDLAHEVDPDLEVPFTYPVIAKPAEVSEWKKAQFEGKQKVHTVASRPELIALLQRIRAAGYRESVIVQDRIPGDDQSMRILTCYCDADSRIRFASYGRTLLEEHSPGAIGNPAAIITAVDEAVVAQAQKLVTELGWTGYANFDLKHDARDGRTKFFELNPRLGRSNYYVTAGGHNPVTWYVREHLGDGLEEAGEILQEQEEALYTVVPLALVRRYTTLPDAKDQLRRVIAAKRVRNPLLYRGVEKDPRRWAMIAAAMANYVRKFRRYYHPEDFR
ncbi:carboxylate--amine ligase [Brachybacterium hainanense]|uniref:ATP-grasp domain-containing protein n=1 Tax=Brachybacterium hainanense TaxID=1541174 RepID=A0ABV6RAZ1_9MICO